MGQLYRRMDEDLRLRGVADSTRRAYLSNARYFVEHYMRSPRELGAEDVIFDRRPDATERLVTFAESFKGQKKDQVEDLAWRKAPVEERGGKPYAIPAGASDHPLGGLGFARWAGEVAEQERELEVFFDKIVVCSVSG